MSKENRQTKQESSKDSELPPIEFHGRTYFQSDFEGCATFCDEIIRRIDKLSLKVFPIGFDLEWLAYSYGNATNKTALAQLCISPRTCHLFHLYNLQKLPAAFVLLLSHPKVKLVGVNVTQDVRRLGRDFPGFPAQKIVENNCIESGKVANEILGTSIRWSLARLTAYLLKKKLAKPVNVRKGKWHILPLSDAQLSYAATDAYASLITYVALQQGNDKSS